MSTMPTMPRRIHRLISMPGWRSFARCIIARVTPHLVPANVRLCYLILAKPQPSRRINSVAFPRSTRGASGNEPVRERAACGHDESGEKRSTKGTDVNPRYERCRDPQNDPIEHEREESKRENVQ